MSAVHIDLIVGNRHSLHNEEKVETMGGRQPLTRKAESLSDDVLEDSINLPEKLTERVAENIRRIKAGEAAQH